MKPRHLAGFCAALPLFVLSVSGVLLAFAAPRGEVRRARPLDRPALDVDSVIARAEAVAGGRATGLTWPTERSADWTVAFGVARSVKVADDTGTTVVAVPGREPGYGTAWVRRLHDGEGTGPVWQAIIVAAGLVPALIVIAGIARWRRERRTARR